MSWPVTLLYWLGAFLTGCALGREEGVHLSPRAGLGTVAFWCAAWPVMWLLVWSRLYGRVVR